MDDGLRGERPEGAPALPGDVTCLDLESGESLVAVSPQGFAWLTRPSDGGTHVRVIDATDMSVASEREVALVEPSSWRAWSAGSASVSADGALWRLEELARVRIESPRASMTGASLCGALDARGLVLADGWLHELADGAWRGWESGEAGAEAPSRLVGRLGECAGPDGVTWATSESGVLWRIEGGVAARHARFDALGDAAATAFGVAALDGDLLWVGSSASPEEWTYYDFEGEEASALAASSASLWVLTSAGLWRHTGGEWATLALPDGQQPSALHAHDGGVWWADEARACHHASGAGARVEGVTPFSSTRASSLLLRVEAEGELEVRAGGESLEAAGADGSWAVNVPLDGLGWHAITLTTPQGSRDLYVERIPLVERSWAEDIEPIHAIHCAECHGGADAPFGDLSTHALWVENAERIREYVVDAQSMPPEAARKDAWGDDAVDAITQWLDGERNP